ncbi:MAG: cbb3-type cytochrome oxidase assembly protein CcoS [Magnetococcus sp. DMHC-1]|nr:cbb3-type cytochrome oxidase assembly protein CcoS [Magnetococcales bacterium]
MDAVFFLLPLALLLSIGGVATMIWAMRRGQFDDMEGPRHRILFEDDQEMLPDPKPAFEKPATLATPGQAHQESAPGSHP